MGLAPRVALREAAAGRAAHGGAGARPRRRPTPRGRRRSSSCRPTPRRTCCPSRPRAWSRALESRADLALVLPVSNEAESTEARFAPPFAYLTPTLLGEAVAFAASSGGELRVAAAPDSPVYAARRSVAGRPPSGPAARGGAARGGRPGAFRRHRPGRLRPSLRGHGRLGPRGPRGEGPDRRRGRARRGLLARRLGGGTAGPGRQAHRRHRAGPRGRRGRRARLRPGPPGAARGDRATTFAASSTRSSSATCWSTLPTRPTPSCAFGPGCRRRASSSRPCPTPATGRSSTTSSAGASTTSPTRSSRAPTCGSSRARR